MSSIDAPHVEVVRRFIMQNYPAFRQSGFRREEVLLAIYDVSKRSAALNYLPAMANVADAFKTINRNFEERFWGLILAQNLVNGQPGKAEERTVAFARLRDSLGQREGIAPIVPTRGRNSVYIIPNARAALKEQPIKVRASARAFARILKGARDLHAKFPGGWAREALPEWKRLDERFRLTDGLQQPPGQQGRSRKKSP